MVKGEKFSGFAEARVGGDKMAKRLEAARHEQAERNRANEDESRIKQWAQFLIKGGMMAENGKLLVKDAKQIFAKGLDAPSLYAVKRYQENAHYESAPTEEVPMAPEMTQAGRDAAEQAYEAEEEGYGVGQDVRIRFGGETADEFVRVAQVNEDEVVVVTNEGRAAGRGKDLSTLIEEGLAYRLSKSNLDALVQHAASNQAKERKARAA
jgi:nucleotide-binding universal stress UspA family protein